MALSSLPTLPVSISSLLTFRNLLLLVLALLNLKNLPLVWHLRVFYHAVANLRSHKSPQRALTRASPTIHPIFATHVLTTHSPLLEIDYNLHKSNSTYFTDLDHSRTALVFSLMSPGFKSGNAELEAQGHRGRFVVVLGSVHATFRREVKPYERYEVRSRMVAWDQKWLVIGSWFVRPAKRGRPEEVLACALSKYVVKKGRFTVSPERCWRHAGLLPERPGEKGDQSNGVVMGESKWEEVAQGDQNGHAVEGLTTAVAPDALGKVVELDEMMGLDKTQPGHPNDDGTKTAQEWTWDQIEKERLRGLELARGWLALDAELLQEFSRVPGS